jgi:hypothetical protein
MANEMTPFVMGELCAGSREMRCEHSPNCDEHSRTIFLSPAEVEKLNRQLPGHIEDGLARGPIASHIILQERMGVVLCIEHKA